MATRIRPAGQGFVFVFVEGRPCTIHQRNAQASANKINLWQPELERATENTPNIAEKLTKTQPSAADGSSGFCKTRSFAHPLCTFRKDHANQDIYANQDIAQTLATNAANEKIARQCYGQ